MTRVYPKSKVELVATRKGRARLPPSLYVSNTIDLPSVAEIEVISIPGC